MTDPDYTHLLLIVDRSGSMSNIAHDMQGGLETLLRDQAAAEGTTLVDAWRFDDKIEEAYHDYNAKKASRQVLILPRGGTALLDAVGSAVTAFGERLSRRREEDRPGTVQVVVVTDGYENSSREWSRERVRDLVRQQTDVYGWQFVFLGANLDAVSVGADMGFAAANSMTYAANAGAVANSIGTTSGLLRSARGAVFSGYTDADRLDAVVSE